MTGASVLNEHEESNVVSLGSWREEGVLAAKVMGYLALGDAAKRMDVDGLRTRHERAIVAWACSQGNPRGSWVALGGLTIRQSFQDRLQFGKTQVSRAVVSLVERELAWIDRTARQQERIRVLTPRMLELASEVEFRTVMAKDIPATELDKIVTRIGWAMAFSRLRGIFDDDDLALDVGRVQDRRRAWDELIDQGPQGTRKLW